MEITFRLFVQTLEDPSLWLKVLPKIQSILNNSFSFTIRQTPNKIAYSFLSRRLLNLLAATQKPDTYIVRATATDAIFFAAINLKMYFNRKHQLLFMRLGKWAML